MNPLAIAIQFIVPLCLWREARNASQEARRGILHTILNRAKHPAGPYRSCKSVLDQVFCPKQFSSFNPDDPNAHKLPKPSDPVEWKVFEDCVAVCQEPGLDPTNGADSYHSYCEGHPLWPKWAVSGKETAQIGPFRFYRLY